MLDQLECVPVVADDVAERGLRLFRADPMDLTGAIE